MKDFIGKSTLIGFISQFRNNLAKALQQIMKTKCPSLQNCISIAHTLTPLQAQAPPNMDFQLLKSISSLANDIGITSKIDTTWSLHSKVLIADTQPWTLLPYLVAATFWSLAQEEGSVIIGKIDGLENNGHLLAQAFALQIGTANNMASSILSTANIYSETIKVRATIFLNKTKYLNCFR
jgi:hypothetical protein